jgi:hypothetical protein
VSDEIVETAKVGYAGYVLQMSLYQAGQPEPDLLPDWDGLSSREQLSWISAASKIVRFAIWKEEEL